MDARQIFIKAWQGGWPSADEFLYLTDRNATKDVIEVLKFLNEHSITVNEAEEELMERRKRCIC